MTKLNHSRPYLKYIDNLRHELRRDARRTDTLEFGITATARPSQAQLNPSDARLLLRLLDELDAYFIAVNDTMLALGKQFMKKCRKGGGARAKQELAEQSLLRIATAVAASALLGEIRGNGRMLQAYVEVSTRLRKIDETAWDTLNNFAMRVAMERLSAAIDSKLSPPTPA